MSPIVMTVPAMLAMIPCMLWYVELKFRDVSIGLCGNMPTAVIDSPNKINGISATRNDLTPSITIPPPSMAKAIIMMELF